MPRICQITNTIEKNYINYFLNGQMVTFIFYDFFAFQTYVIILFITVITATRGQGGDGDKGHKDKREKVSAERVDVDEEN